MPEWTREHDAHIARECEGMQVMTCHDAYAQAGISNWLWIEEAKQTHGNYWVWHPENEWMPVPSYTTDANARDRAAEAWRRQVEGRSYTLMSAMDEEGEHHEARAIIWQHSTPTRAIAKGENALLWALWKATGGQE